MKSFLNNFGSLQSRKALKAAFPFTLPIFAGFWFLGISYGIYMNVCGFSWIYPALMSLTIFAGSVEFIVVNLLLGSFNPIQAFALTFIVNSRHLFYGISMLDKYRGLGMKKFYLTRFFAKFIIQATFLGKKRACRCWCVGILFR